MEMQSLFTIPLYQADYPDHKKNKDLYKTFIDEHIDNMPNQIRFDKISHATRKTLHSISVFNNLVYFLGTLCPELHKDFIISDEKSIAINAMWASRCKQHENIPDQFHKDSFIYGVYFLQTPQHAGKIHIVNDITDRNYYDEIVPDQPNVINSNHFQGHLPEGSILLMPSHLTTSYTFNLSQENRYMIHFLLKVIY